MADSILSAAMPPMALTFDDGPHPEWTPKILEVLRREPQVRATFFVWGTQAAKHPDVIQDVLSAGHSVQPHCWSHKSHWNMTPEEIRADIDRVLSLLHDLRVPAPDLWRPPWGQLLRRATKRIAGQRGLELAGWTIESKDWLGTGAEEMHAAVIDRIAELGRRNRVLVMHDSHLEPTQRRSDTAQTVELVKRLISDPRLSFAPLKHGIRPPLKEGPQRPRFWSWHSYHHPS
jgi:peptidoglycan-N-acetylglucosamine deacetylase